MSTIEPKLIDWIHEQFPAALGNLELAWRIAGLEKENLKVESLQKALSEAKAGQDKLANELDRVEDEYTKQLEAAQQRIKALEEQGVDLRSKAISCFDSAVTNDATPKGFYLVPDNAMLDLRQAAFSIHPIATEALENKQG